MKKRYLALIFIIVFGASNISLKKGSLVSLSRIKMIESAGLPFVIGSSGEIGLYQISDCVLEDYNKYHKVKVAKWMLFIPWTNEKVAYWYLNTRIPSMLRHYEKPVTIRNIIISYNAGIGYVAHDKDLPEITKKYLKKYGVK